MKQQAKLGRSPWGRREEPGNRIEAGTRDRGQGNGPSRVGAELRTSDNDPAEYERVSRHLSLLTFSMRHITAIQLPCKQNTQLRLFRVVVKKMQDTCSLRPVAASVYMLCSTSTASDLETSTHTSYLAWLSSKLRDTCALSPAAASQGTYVRLPHAGPSNKHKQDLGPIARVHLHAAGLQRSAGRPSGTR
jgi:hypothetical protein